MHKNIQEILDRRAEIEKEIIKLLEETKSPFTLDHVKDIIYREKETDDMQKVIAIFDDGNPENLSNTLEKVTDTWNYFPHKIIGDLSPAEILLKHKEK